MEQHTKLNTLLQVYAENDGNIARTQRNEWIKTIIARNCNVPRRIFSCAAVRLCFWSTLCAARATNANQAVSCIMYHFWWIENFHFLAKFCKRKMRTKKNPLNLKQFAENLKYTIYLGAINSAPENLRVQLSSVLLSTHAVE